MIFAVVPVVVFSSFFIQHITLNLITIDILQLYMVFAYFGVLIVSFGRNTVFNHLWDSLQQRQEYLSKKTK